MLLRYIPLVLTLFRLVVGVAVVPVVLSSSWFEGDGIQGVLVGVAVAACMATDYLDGYVARRWQVTSRIGAICDPIADKFFVLSSYITLLHLGRIGLTWVLCIVMREVAVMAMREIALTHRFSLPVVAIGKVKTATQMVALVWLVMALKFPHSEYVTQIIVMVMGGVTVLSGVVYLVRFVRLYKGAQKEA